MCVCACVRACVHAGARLEWSVGTRCCALQILFCLEADCANVTRDTHRVYVVIMYTEVNASDTRYERSLC